MTGFVAHDVAQQLLEQGLIGHLLHVAECGESKTLNHDLHSEVGHVPTAVIHDVVKQHTQVSVDLVRTTQLLIEVTSEHFNVASFVDYLGAGVQLGVVPRNSLNDFRGTNKCTLLAVHEL